MSIAYASNGPIAALPPAGHRLRPSLALLREVPLLAPLSQGHLATLAENAHLASYRRGQVIVAQGQRCDQLLCVLSGRAHAVRQGPSGRSVLMEVLARGDLIGPLGLIDGEPEAATVRANTQMDMLALDGGATLHCLRQAPVLADALAQLLVKRLRKINRRIASLALHHVRDRMIWHLLERGERESDGRWRVRERVNRTELALTIGASREMVSRMMGQLAREGVVENLADGGMRVLPSPSLATTMAQGEAQALSLPLPSPTP